MPSASRKINDARKKILRDAEDIVTSPDAEGADDISRTGMVWSGILDLDTALPPYTVAAMLSAYELVKATSRLESEQHWTEAAAFAAVGAYCDEKLKGEKTEESVGAVIGFGVEEVTS
jgi:hypothetical protein